VVILGPWNYNTLSLKGAETRQVDPPGFPDIYLEEFERPIKNTSHKLDSGFETEDVCDFVKKRMNM